MNIQNYVTQQLVAPPVSSSPAPSPFPSRSSLSHDLCGKIDQGDCDENHREGEGDGEDEDDDVNDNPDDVEVHRLLQIRFISVSSVSSSAFSHHFEETDQLREGANGSRKLRGRSNTLEKLEEEKRVRWLDESSGALVSTFDTILSLPHGAHATLLSSVSGLKINSKSLKESPSFELITISSPRIHSGNCSLLLSLLRLRFISRRETDKHNRQWKYHTRRLFGWDRDWL
jgi:hypothetical protein